MEFKKINYDKISNLYFFILLISVFFSETVFIDTSILSYFLILILIFFNLQKLSFTKFQYFSILLSLLYFIIVLILAKYSVGKSNSNSSLYSFSILSNFKFYFGFVLFLIFFQLYGLNKNLANILKLVLFLCCLFVYFDAVIINLFDINIHQEEHTAYFFNFYKRPPGFAGNSSISAISILIVYFILKKFYFIKFDIFENIFIFFTIVLLFSTTGFLTLIIFIFLLNNIGKINFYLNSILYCLALFLLFLASLAIDPEIAQKISWEYVMYVTSEKIFFFKYFFLSNDLIFSNHNDLYFYEKFFFEVNHNLSCHNIFFGCQINENKPMTSGDNGIISLYLATGLIGLIIFFLLSLSFLNFSKTNIFYLIIIIFISFHYGFIFFIIFKFFKNKYILLDYNYIYLFSLWIYFL